MLLFQISVTFPWSNYAFFFKQNAVNTWYSKIFSIFIAILLPCKDVVLTPKSLAKATCNLKSCQLIPSIDVYWIFSGF